MKTAPINRSIIFCILILSLSLAGCASGGRRFYSESVRPVKDVAVVYANSACRVDSVAESGKPKKDLDGGGYLLGELLPGNYIFNTRFVYMGTYSNVVGQAVDLPLRAEAGHIYYIYAKSPGNGWQPAIIDIMEDADYGRIDEAGYSGDLVRNAVAKYLTGGREIIQETKFVSDGKVLSIWR